LCEIALVIQSLVQGAGLAPEIQEALPAPPSQESKECAIAVAPDGQSVATGIGSSLQLWSRTASGAWQASDTKEVHRSVLALAFSPTGDRLACAGRLDHILLWGVANGRLQGPIRESEGDPGESVRALAFDPGDQALVSVATDDTATDWRLPELNKGTRFAELRRLSAALAFGSRAGAAFWVYEDAEGQLALCPEGGDDRCVRLGRLGGKKIRGLATNADLSRLIVADDGLWVWDLRRQTMLDTVRRLSR